MEFHVLLVDDDRVTLKTIEQLLRKCNYEVTCAANGREAMKVLTSCRQSGKKVDLVLTDILMPEVTGIELIHEMVHGDTFCDAPVVVMSSQDSQESVLQAFQAGAADYLIKPIRKNELATLWQHVWRATKAKKTGSGTSCPATIAAGDPLTGREESEVAAATSGGGVKAVAAAHGPVNVGSGASSGATTSVIQSTGGSMLPAHAATVRQLMVTAATALPPGTSEQSGNMNITEAQNSWPRLFHHASSFDGGASSAANGSSAVRPFLGDGGGSSNTPHAPAARRSTVPFCTSVSVNFEMNPLAAEERRLEHLGAAQGAGAVCWPACTYATAAAATPQCAARTSATVIRCPQANPEEAEPKYNRDTDIDIITTAVAPVLDVAAAADDDYGDVHRDSRDDGENPLRKRKRLATGPVYNFQRRQVRHPDADPYTNADDRYAVARPAMTTAMVALITVASDAGAGGSGSGCGEGFTAATAPAVGRLAVAEGSQGSRAASACAEGEGCGAAALRQSTATPSSDTFAESPSPYTATITTTATITVTTSSGSETDEQQSQQPQPHQQQQRRNRELQGGTSAGCLLPQGGATARTDINGLRGAAVGRVLDRTMEEAAANGTDANTHCTATSAGPRPAPAPAPAAAVAAAPAAQHSLPHPSAAAPPRTASSGGVVTLPPGLRELATLGSARHRELWAQRAMLHEQQQKQQLKEVVVAHARIGAASACVQLHQSLKRGRGGGAGVGHSGMASSAVEATEPEAPARGPCTAAQGATAAELHPQRRRDIALVNDNGRGSNRAGAGGGGDFGSCTAASSRTESTAADGAGAAVRSQSSHSLALLRHSDRSAFAAFSVFLPERLAAPPAPPQQPSQLLHSTPSPGQLHAPLLSQQVAAAAATAASGGNGSGNCTTSMLYSYHPAFLPALPPPQHDLRYPGPLLQPGVVHLIPSILPLHMGFAATAGTPPAVHGAPKHADPAAGGAVGLGSAAAAAAVASVHAPYAAMQQGHGVFCPLGTGLQVSVPQPPVRISESVLHLIAQLSGRGAAQIPLQETITPAPFVGQKAQSAARLAAVAKYLEKRKRRNFQKKVRYESRKRLAEARPRVRGQFVRSTVPVTAPGPSTLSPWQPQDPAATSPTAAVTAPLHAWGPASGTSTAAVLQLLKMLPVPLPSVG